jgi:NDP-sugar pyrophosphorylase family protein
VPLEGVTALVMAGGSGTRMARTRPGIPKPLITVGGHALLELALRQLVAAGVRDIRIALRHEAAAIEAHVRALPGLPQQAVTMIVEPEPLGTIGALGLLRDVRQTVLVANGDLVSGIDLRALHAFHRERRADLTIATHDEHHRLRLGEVVSGPDDCVLDYVEKPVKTFRISSGTYLLEPAIVRHVAPGEWLGFPELARRAIRSGQRVLECFHAEPWLDVNDEHDLRAAEELLANDPAAFGLPRDALRRP